MFAEDLGTLLTGAGVVASVYFGTTAQIPDADGPYLSIVETSGSGVEYRQDVAGASMEMPGAQIVVRACDYVVARALAWRAWETIVPVRNRVVGATWYRGIAVQQLPFDLGLDATGRRVRIAFNVLGDKKPS